MVEFDLDSSTGRPFASNISPTNRYLIVGGSLLAPQDARAPALAIIERVLLKSKRRSVPIDFIEKRTTVRGAGSLPVEFWKALGYNSFGGFVTSSSKLFGFPPGDDAQYISLEPFGQEVANLESVKEWMHEHLLAVAKPIPLGELAEKASGHFTKGAFPVRVQIGVRRFSDIFNDDNRFVISGGKIAASGAKEPEILS